MPKESEFNAYANIFGLSGPRETFGPSLPNKGAVPMFRYAVSKGCHTLKACPWNNGFWTAHDGLYFQFIERKSSWRTSLIRQVVIMVHEKKHLEIKLIAIGM